MNTDRDIVEAIADIAMLRNDPVLFVESQLGATPQPWQAQALTDVRDSPRTAIASCNGAGKSTFLAWLLLWFLLTRFPTKVVATAGSANQLSDVLWAEVGAWIQKLRNPMLRDALSWTSYRVELLGAPNSFATARTSRREQPDALQGHHSPNMLFLLDEASGIPDQIFEVGEGSMSTEGAKTVMTGNPLRRQGYFFDAFHRNRENWITRHVNAFECDYVTADFIRSIRDQWGENSAVYRARVLGLFPEADEDVLIPAFLIEAAMARVLEPSSSHRSVWGLDVARFGADRSTLCKRRGPVITEPIRVFRSMDLMELTGHIVAEWNDTLSRDRPDEIFVDSIGLGAGVVDRLREMGLPAVAINVSEISAVNPDKFSRLRDELWYRCRQWFESRNCALQDDEGLVRELTAPTYTFKSDGKLQIEPKSDTRKRLGYSPDKADALVLTFARDGAIASGQHSGVAWSRPLGSPHTSQNWGGVRRRGRMTA